MIVCCAWCQREDRPALLGETQPYRDTTVSHGICAAHAAQLKAEISRPCPHCGGTGRISM